MQVGLLWSKDFFLSLSLNGDINMLDPSFASSRPVSVIQGHQGAVTSMFFDRERKTLFSGSLDGVIISRDLSTGRVYKVKGSDKKHIAGACHTNKVTGIAVMDDELVSVGWDDQVRYASVASNLYNSAQVCN
jgi:WD40 repeat protein